MEYGKYWIERPKHVWTYDWFKVLIAHACENNKQGIIPFDHLPDVIDLGATQNSLRNKAIFCARATKHDASSRERGLNIIWNSDAKKYICDT